MDDQEKVKKIEEEMKKEKTDKSKETPNADNASKLVNSGRSKNKRDLQVKNKITGAEFEGPPY
jgi:hypothetical protein